MPAAANPDPDLALASTFATDAMRAATRALEEVEALEAALIGHERVAACLVALGRAQAVVHMLDEDLASVEAHLMAHDVCPERPSRTTA